MGSTVEHLIKSLRIINYKECISFLKRYDEIFHAPVLCVHYCHFSCNGNRNCTRLQN